MLVIVLTAFFGGLPAHGNSIKGGETKAKLESLVDEYIASCDAKSAMRSSRSENIRRSANRSCMKATYCRSTREELVKEMLENNIEPKAYKVHLYLNEKFQGHVQAKE